MNAVTQHEGSALSPAQEFELTNVLRSSLYPGASPESIKMVLGYCRAAGLDPMQKPVHIVPMWDGKARQMRDVVTIRLKIPRRKACRFESGPGHQGSQRERLLT